MSLFGALNRIIIIIIMLPCNVCEALARCFTSRDFTQSVEVGIIVIADVSQKVKHSAWHIVRTK